MSVMQIAIYEFGRLVWQYRCCITRIAWMAVVLACAGKASPLPAQTLQSIIDLNADANKDGGGSTNCIWQGVDADSKSAVSKVPQLPAYQLNFNTMLMSERNRTDSEPQLLGSPPGGLLLGIPSQPSSFATSAELTGDSDDRKLVPPKLLLGHQDCTSELSHAPSISQLEPFLHPAIWIQHQETTAGNSQLFHLDSFTATMTGNGVIKDAVGGQSGFFSRARMGLDYDYWRVESGIGIAWTTLLDKSKPLVDFGSRENVVWNLSLLYFPWGDFRWRPFLLLGTGISELNTLGGSSQGNSATVYTGISHKN
jgi:hypothetical protein